jgi:hypothetical protein
VFANAQIPSPGGSFCDPELLEDLKRCSPPTKLRPLARARQQSHEEINCVSIWKHGRADL